MKALDKKRLLIMINSLYKNDDDIIYSNSLQKYMETYGDDYYINRDYGKFELCNKNPNWKDN